MKIFSQKPLSEVHKSLPTAERLEQDITELEIDSIEQDQQLTDLEIAVMELQEAQEG